jgi:hypothetical protein
VKPSEPSRLDYRVSSLADDIFEDDPIPSEPPGGLGSRLSSLAVDLFEQSIPSEPPKLHSRLSSAVCKNAWGAVQEDQKPSRLGSRLSRSADEHDNGIDGTSSDDGIAESISSKPVGLGTRQSRSTDNVFECDDGITDSNPREPANLGSRLSRNADAVFKYDNGITDSISSESPELGSRQSRSTDDIFECDRLSASVGDLFGLGADTLDPLDGEYLPDQEKPMSRSTKDLFHVDDDDGIADLTRFRANLLDSVLVSRIRWKIDSVSATTMESRILLSRFQASLLDSALDSLLMMKTISSFSTCRDNYWGAVQEDPSEPKPSRLGSRLSRSADEHDNGIPDSIPSESPELHSYLSSTVCKNSWGAVQEEQKPSRLGSRLSRSADECEYGIADSIPSEPPELCSSLSALVSQDSRGAAQEDPSEAECTDDPIPSEPPDGLDSCFSSSANDLFERDHDHGIKNPVSIPSDVATDDPIPSEPPDGLGSCLWTTHGEQFESDDLFERDDGILAVLIPSDVVNVDPIPSEPPDGFGSHLLSSANDLFERDHRIKNPVSIPNDVAIDDPIPSEPPDGLGSCLWTAHGEQFESDDLFERDDGILPVLIPSDVVADDPIPSEPPDGFESHLLSSADDLFERDHAIKNPMSIPNDVANDDPIPSEPPDGLGSCLSSSSDDLFEPDHGIKNPVSVPSDIVTDDPIPSEPPDGLGSRQSCSYLSTSIDGIHELVFFGLDNEHGVHVATDDSILIESSRLGSRLPSLDGDLFEHDDHGITPFSIPSDVVAIPSEPPDGLGSYLSYSSDNLFEPDDSILSKPPEGLGSRLLSSGGNLIEQSATRKAQTQECRVLFRSVRWGVTRFPCSDKISIRG